MGLLSRLTRKKLDASTEAGGQLAANDGTNHNLATSKVLAATDSAVPTPTNADFSSVRSVPVVQKPRYFNKAEADALAILAKQKQVEAEALGFRFPETPDHWEPRGLKPLIPNRIISHKTPWPIRQNRPSLPCHYRHPVNATERRLLRIESCVNTIPQKLPPRRKRCEDAEDSR